MKKLFLILSISVIIFSQNSFSQSNHYNKKEIKELNKHLNNLNLDIIIRGLDLNKIFVVKSGYTAFTFLKDSKDEESSWNTALFKNGIDVGSYYEKKQVKDGDNREMTLYESIIVKGDYLIEIYRDNLKISDVNNDYKLVGTITFNINTIRFKDDYHL